MSISRNGPIALQYPGSHAQFIQWERRRGELSLFRFARSPAAAGRRGDQNVKRRLRFEQLLQRRLIQHLHPPSASTTTATAATTQRGARTHIVRGRGDSGDAVRGDRRGAGVAGDGNDFTTLITQHDGRGKADAARTAEDQRLLALDQHDGVVGSGWHCGAAKFNRSRSTIALPIYIGM
jgi:hypothetical protein